MTPVHDAYAAAVRRNLYDLGRDWAGWLPRLIAEWEAIDDHHRAGAELADRPADAEIAAPKPARTRRPRGGASGG